MLLRLRKSALRPADLLQLQSILPLVRRTAHRALPDEELDAIVAARAPRDLPRLALLQLGGQEGVCQGLAAEGDGADDDQLPCFCTLS